MAKKNKDIKNNYQLFIKLVQEKKTVCEAVILLREKGNNPRFVIGFTETIHEIIDDVVLFTIEQSKKEQKYHVKLRCKSLTPVPYFRFDSDGPTHRNKTLGVPLLQQSITTPHFNTFNEEGEEIAYKTDTLKRIGDANAIVASLDFGIAHFCDEANCYLSDGQYPKAKEHGVQILLTFEDNDISLGGPKFE